MSETKKSKTKSWTIFEQAIFDLLFNLLPGVVWILFQIVYLLLVLVGTVIQAILIAAIVVVKKPVAKRSLR